jgi:hypothetical protein
MVGNVHLLRPRAAARGFDLGHQRVQLGRSARRHSDLGTGTRES